MITTSFTALLTASVLLTCLPVPSHQLIAYFSGSQAIRLSNTLNFYEGLSFRLKTCSTTKVGQILHQTGSNGDSLTFILLTNGELRLKWVAQGLEDYKIVGYDLNNNVWHTIHMKYVDVSSLVISVDGQNIVLANSTYQPHLLSLNLSSAITGSLIIGQNFDGCIDDGIGIMFSSPDAQFSNNIQLGICPLDSSNACAPPAALVASDTSSSTCSIECMNGGVCSINQFDESICQCQDGFAGVNCQTNINDCDPNPCMNGAECVDGVGNYTCKCLENFIGIRCDIPKNDCVPNPCLNGGVCFIDQESGIQCNCPADWIGPRCEDLRDVCSPSPCKHGQCNRHFENSDNISYRCSCDAGFSGKNCETDIDDCTGVTCQNGQVCFDMVDNYECRCPTGYGGFSCQEQVVECQSDSCLNGGTCTVVNRNVTCQCVDGWTGPNCSEDINECDERPCAHGICQNKPGSFQCYCTPGYSGISCNMEVNECLSDPCKNGATCENLVNKYKCKCAPGYIGLNCEIDINECESQPCKNGATCMDQVNAFNCTCVPGFTGLQCEINIDECEPVPCKNGGLCTDKINAFECNCTDTGFFGDFCQNNIDDCEGQPCVSDANCTDLIKDYNCSCHPGYTGKNCEEDIDECTATPCQNGATCLQKSDRTLYDSKYNDFFKQPFTFATSGGYICECLLGFNGSDCENNIDDCGNNLCVNGSCVDGINDYTCNCTKGFEGQYCDVEIDECERYNPCKNNAPCVDLVGDYQCTCQEKYGGKNCSIELIGCLDHQCANGATCHPYVTESLVHKYNCLCASGFYGDLCKKSSSLSFHGNGFITPAKLVDSSARDKFILKMSFKTTLASGLLAIGSTLDNLNYFLLAVENHHVYLNVSSNGVLATLTTGKVITTGDYITVNLLIDGSKTDLRIENDRKFKNFDFASVSKLGNLFFGGYGFSNELYAGIPPFIGCMQDIIMNKDNRVTFLNSDIRYDVLQDCDRVEQCDPNQCVNNGVCMDLWNDFNCQCSRPYFGHLCDKFDTPGTFGYEDQKSMASFNINPVMQAELQNNFNMSLFLRTRKQNGLIFYVGPQVLNGQFQQGFLMTRLAKGKLQVILNNQPVALFQDVPQLNDGYYHKIEVTVGGGFIKAFVNDTLNLYDELFTQNNLFFTHIYIGRLPGTQVDAFRRKRQIPQLPNDEDSFKGILWDIQLNGKAIQLFENSTSNIELLAVANTTNVQNGVVSDDTCKVNPCQNDGKCQVTWNDYTCMCPAAFRGKNCTDHKPCSIYSCPDDGKCVDLKHGYECVTTATFNGKNASITFTPVLDENTTVSSISFRYRTKTVGRTILFLIHASEFLVIEINSKIILHFQNNKNFMFGENAADGNWHNVSVMFDATHVTGIFDGIKDSDESIFDLFGTVSSGDIYVGSAKPDIANGSPALFGLSSEEHHFKGCIEEIRIGGLLLPFFDRDTMANDRSHSYFAPVSMSGSDVAVDKCQLCYNSDCQNGGVCGDALQMYECTCPDGFEGQFCEVNIDECVNNECENGAACVDGINGYTCLCNLGFVGQFCENDLCEPNPCEHGNCSRENGTYSCQCSFEYFGNNCTQLVTCASYPCKMGSTCQSKTGQVPAFHCNCTLGYTGIFCDEEVDFCESMPCFHDGNCTSLATPPHYTCECADGWTGAQCQIDVDDCVSQPCLNGGTCIDGLNNYTCSCPDEFEGSDCELDVDECSIYDDLCENGGTCNNMYGSYNCSCLAEWVGSTCNISDLCYSDQFACFNGGSCNMDLQTGLGYCDCTPNYSGDHCQEKQVGESNEPDLALVIGPAVGAFILICIIAGLVTFFMMARKKRATRGTYSPSRQEMFGSRVEMGNVMKPPPEERLI